MFFLTLKCNWVQLSRIFPTLRKSKFSFPSFFQHKKWQSPTFCIYSDHKILQSLSFRAFSAIKNYKVQLSKLFPPSKMTKSNFPSFLRLKKWQKSPNFRTFSDINNGNVQISKLFPNYCIRNSKLYSESPATGHWKRLGQRAVFCRLHLISVIT